MEADHGAVHYRMVARDSLPARNRLPRHPSHNAIQSFSALCSIGLLDGKPYVCSTAVRYTAVGMTLTLALSFEQGGLPRHAS